MAGRYGFGGPAEPDVRELLKREAFMARNSRCDTHFEKSRPCAAGDFGTSDQYFVADSWLLKSAPRWNHGEFPFTMMIQGASGDGGIGIHDMMDTVIQIQVFEAHMGLPELVDVDAGEYSSVFTLAADPGASDPRGANPVTSANSQLPHGGRVTLYLKEVGKQAFLDRRTRRHHFEFNAAVVGTPGEPNAMMRLTPVNELYTFTQPIRDITNLSLCFYNPDEPMRLPADTVVGVTFSTSAGGAGLPAIQTLIVNGPSTTGDGRTLDFGDLLVPGDRIYFENIAIDTAAAGAERLSALQNYLMKSDGLFVGNFPGYANLSAQQFTLDPLPTVPALAGGSTIPLTATATLRIAKNRLRMSFRARRVVEGVTNYIDP